MSTTAESKGIVRRYYEETLNETRMDLLGGVDREGCRQPRPTVRRDAPPEEARGFEGFRRHAEIFHEAFPDGRVSIDDIIAERDTVAARFTIEGTHEVRFGGIEPTGNRISETAMVFYRIEGGKIAERLLESDNLEMLRQLDALELLAA